MNWNVYIILCTDSSLYTGISNDVARRFNQHKDQQQGAKYFRARQPKTLVYLETGHDRSSASKREIAIKKLSRSDKLQLLQSDSNQANSINSPGMDSKIFDQDCRLCKRLDDFLCGVKQKHPEYHARPVAPFGDSDAKLLIVGLAPGMHGANATGRPFTGDYAGLLLYQTLYDFGYCNKPTSESLIDGLELKNCRITNAVKCLPPENKPTSTEINQCNAFLAAELATLPERSVILALGTIAHQAVLKAVGLKLSSAVFGHNVQHDLPSGHTLVDSYHTSRYNIQTKRLTSDMFADVFNRIGRLFVGG
jgi:uracil-DNA glycosylase family 4